MATTMETPMTKTMGTTMENHKKDNGNCKDKDYTQTMETTMKNPVAR